MNQLDQDLRVEQLQQWLHTELGDVDWSLEVASADASFRRYFRIKLPNKTLIAMDAPPGKEDVAPFVHVATAFKALNVNVPEIFAKDLAQGFMLLQDFGSTCYLDELNQDNADALYQDALDALLTLQSAKKPNDDNMPPYDAALLMREMALFTDWFLAKHLEVELSNDEKAMTQSVFEFLRDNALAQPQVWVHRDYHSRNLMCYSLDNPGIIDFQDAVNGAITYDVVSLLRDCYISWPDEKVYAWLENYLKALKQNNLCKDTDFTTFTRWFDLMGMQRHLKAIGIFSRLNYRDGKSGYLNDIPRTFAYVEAVCKKYSELSQFSHLLQDKIKPILISKSRL